jgi:hypothetical protein
METTTSNNTLQPLRPQTHSGYPHGRFKVTELKDRSNDTIQGWVFDRNTGKIRDKITNNPNNVTFTNAVGMDIHCPKELYEFAMEIKKVMPNVDFHYYRGGFVYEDHPIDSLVVYREGDVYAMGVIGYAHTSLFTGRSPNYGEPVKRQYVVFSPYVTNSKYRGNSDAFHMKAATTLTAAMKNVKKHLRPYSPVDVAYTHLGRVENCVRRKYEKITSSMHSVSYEASRNVGMILKELQALHTKQADKIVNHAVEKILQDYMEWQEKVKAEGSKPMNATFVLVRHDNSVATLEF